MTNKIHVWPAGSIWAYRAVFTQTATGGGAIKADFSPGIGSQMFIIHFMTGPDDYSGARTVTIFHRDSANNLVTASWLGLAVDNQKITFPHSLAVGAANSAMGMARSIWDTFLSGSDKLAVEISDAGAANETLTVTIRARIRGLIPTVSKARSGAPSTVSITETYNLVI